MISIHRIRRVISVLLPALFLFSCNLPSSKPVQSPAPVTPSNGVAVATETKAGAAGTAEPCGSSADGALRVCFLDLSDGQTIAATPGEPVRISAVASGAVVAGISLSTDAGGYAQFVANAANTDPFRADFSWTPALGAGTYPLTLETLTADKSEVASVILSVKVTGLAAVSPSPTSDPNAVPAEMENQVIEIFSKTFGVNIIAPAIARKYREGVEDPWISTAYIGDEFYEVEVFPDGHSENYINPIFPNTNIDFKKSLFKEPVCRPAGVYSMLVVFLDFGNIAAGKDEILSDLEAAAATVNGDYAAYPSAGPGSAPILEIRPTGVVIPVPKEVKGKLITPAQIHTFSGLDPSTFQWVTQVDLDTASTFRLSSGTMATTSFGYAFSGCPATRSTVNIQVTIDSRNQLAGPDNRLADTLLSHEVFHLFGYPASHLWPCISNVSQTDRGDECVNTNIPALMLGWVDVDGDGVPEILDPTPYGIMNS
ncbi:MAG: hypothetical protein WBM17_17365 [Anaerolineales bacterium]